MLLWSGLSAAQVGCRPNLRCCPVVDYRAFDIELPQAADNAAVIVYSAASAVLTGNGSVPVHGCSAMSKRTPSGP
jgi:hypothetical protein